MCFRQVWHCMTPSRFIGGSSSSPSGYHLMLPCKWVKAVHISAPRALLQGGRMLISDVWSSITTSDFKRMQELLRGQKEAGSVCLRNAATWISVKTMGSNPMTGIPPIKRMSTWMDARKVQVFWHVSQRRSVAEHGMPHCRIEMCNVAPIETHASRTALATCLHGCATPYSAWVTQSRMACWIRSVAFGTSSAGHTC